VTAARLEQTCSRIADQIDTASAVLRQSPVLEQDILRAQRLLEAEVALLRLMRERMLVQATERADLDRRRWAP
jgi:hypothetical protein